MLLQNIWRRSATASPAVRYGVAIVAAVAVSLLRIALNPVWGDEYPFIFFFPTTLFTALLGGLGPGLVSVFVCGIASIWVLPPIGSFPKDAFIMTALAVYLFIDGMIAAIAAQHRAALGRMAHQAQQLQTATRTTEGVQTITDSVLADLPLDRLLHEVLIRVRTAVEADIAVIMLRRLPEEGGEGDEQLDVRAAVGFDDPREQIAPISIGRGFTGAIAKDRRPLVWNDSD